jgi:hypothetical protein
MNSNAYDNRTGAVPIASVSDEQLLAMRPLKPRKKATFESPTPSNYCHICSRTPNRGIRLAICAGLREGHCRKVVCEKCFTDYSLGCTFMEAADCAVNWKCVHCQGICPERAQCRTYQNVNRKLRLQRLRQSADAERPEKMRQPAPSQHNKKQRNADVSVHIPLLSQVGQEYVTPNMERQVPRRAEQFGKASEERSPNSISARGSFVRESIGNRHPGMLSHHSRHTALSSGHVQEKMTSAPGRVYCIGPSRFHPLPYLGETASTYVKTNVLCHICKTSPEDDATSFRNCSGTQNPDCRNTFCNLCSDCKEVQQSRESSEAIGERWNCCHCTGTCPLNSACHTKEGSCSEPEQFPLPSPQTRTKRDKTSLKSRLLAAVAEIP